MCNEHVLENNKFLICQIGSHQSEWWELSSCHIRFSKHRNTEQFLYKVTDGWITGESLTEETPTCFCNLIFKDGTLKGIRNQKLSRKIVSDFFVYLVLKPSSSRPVLHRRSDAASRQAEHESAGRLVRCSSAVLKPRWDGPLNHKIFASCSPFVEVHQAWNAV